MITINSESCTPSSEPFRLYKQVSVHQSNSTAYTNTMRVYCVSPTSRRSFGRPTRALYGANGTSDEVLAVADPQATWPRRYGSPRKAWHEVHANAHIVCTPTQPLTLIPSNGFQSWIFMRHPPAFIFHSLARDTHTHTHTPTAYRQWLAASGSACIYVWMYFYVCVYLSIYLSIYIYIYKAKNKAMPVAGS
jgi:hypothetical protein